MSTPEIPQPHDNLIRHTLGSIDNAISFFRAHLPPALAAALDWDRLHLESGSFVDEELRRSESDLLFSVPLRGADGREVLLYLLFEHQSTGDPFLSQRFLGYMLLIWRRYRKQHPTAKKLPLLLPLLLSQVEGGWNVSTQFADLLDCPEEHRAALEKYLPHFEHLLIDLAKLSNDQLEGNAAMRLAQSLLKAAMEKALLEWLDWAEPLLRVVGSREFLHVLLLYAANAESNLDLRRFVEKIESAKIPNTAETIMSIAERIRIEARQEGLQEGKSIAERIRIEARQEGLEEGRSIAERIRIEAKQEGLEEGRSIAERIRIEAKQEGLEEGRSIAERVRIEARQEGLERGREEGIVRGALIGQIQALQRVLKRPESIPTSLDRLEADQLRAMIAELELELR